MRIFKSMPRWLPAGIFAVILLLSAVLPAAAADTGTYQISNYVVTMEPQSSGQVRMTYQQEWKVLSGHIPWITVGTANSNFTVVSYGEAAARVSAENSGGFTGVRVDLNKDYLPGEAFKVEFVVLQSNLLERLTEEKKWRINFTPGWYENTVIDHLQINLTAPVNTEAYSLLDPQPVINDKTLTWDKYNVPKGGRFNIQVECLDGNFLSASAPISSGSQGPNTWVVVGIIAGILIIIYLLISLAVRQSRKTRDAEMKARIAATEKELAEDREKEKAAQKGFKEYVEEKGLKADEQGRYYDRSYGGYITPIIWMAILSNQSRAAQTPAHTPSCACACVSCACACACACAGGGAAGCSRKTLHECKDCGTESISKRVEG
jgi:hypothetical protein